MQRKHRLQMTAEEIVYAETLVHARDEWSFSPGSEFDKRLQERGITKDQALEALWHGYVVEVNDRGRAVIRSKSGTVVVCSIQDGGLVTTWKNASNDNHSTLDRSAYKWRVNIIDYLRGLK